MQVNRNLKDRIMLRFYWNYEKALELGENEIKWKMFEIFNTIGTDLRKFLSDTILASKEPFKIETSNWQ